MTRADLIDSLLEGLPPELRALAAEAFKTATVEELQELAGCVDRAERGEDLDERAEELGTRSGRRRLEAMDRHGLS